MKDIDAKEVEKVLAGTLKYWQDAMLAANQHGDTEQRGDPNHHSRSSWRRHSSNLKSRIAIAKPPVSKTKIRAAPVLAVASESSGGCLLVQDTNIVVSNLVVTGCNATFGGGIGIINAAVVLTDATLRGNTARFGGAIAASGETSLTAGHALTMRNIEASGNRVFSSQLVAFQSNISSTGGGAVALTTINASLVNVVLTDNACDALSTVMADSGSMKPKVTFVAFAAGGGLLAYDSVVTLSSVTVADNRVSCTGYSCFGGGGGIFTSRGRLDADMVRSTGNTVHCSDGGSCQSFGGGLASYGTAMKVLRSWMVGNSGSCSAMMCMSSGGGMFLLAPGYAVINWGRDIDSRMLSEITSSVVSNNTVSCASSKCMGWGAGLYIDGVDVQISNSSVVRNSVACHGGQSQGLGGGIWVAFASLSATLTQLNANSVECTPTQNDAVCSSQGGGLWTTGDGNFDGSDHIQLHNVSVSANHVSGVDSAGAGLWIAVISIVNITSSTVDDNLIVGNTVVSAVGAGVYAIDAQLTLADSVIRGNILDCSKGPLHEHLNATNSDADATQAFGGGLALVHCNTTITASVIDANQIVAHRNDFSIIGAGLAVMQDSMLYMESSSVSDNAIEGTIWGSGGGAFVQASASFTDCVLARNRVLGLGGGIYHVPIVATGNDRDITASRLLMLRPQLIMNFADKGASAVFYLGSDTERSLNAIIEPIAVFGLNNQVIVNQIANGSSQFDVQCASCPAGAQLTESPIYIAAPTTSVTQSRMWPYSPELRTVADSMFTFQLDCRPCAPGLYSLENGTHTNRHGFCKQCPFGSVCKGGDDIVAQSGYWGDRLGSALPVDHRDRRDGTTQEDIEFYFCPAGYCCPADAAQCPYNYCHGHRAGVLCGSCEPGYGRQFFSTDCVRDDECNDAKWMVPLMIFTVLGYVVMFSLVPPTETGEGNIVTLFYQVTGHVRDTTPIALITVLDALFSGKGELRSGHDDTVSGLCLYSHMGQFAKTAWGYLLPCTVALAVGCIAVVQRIQRNADGSKDSGLPGSEPHTGSESQSLVARLWHRVPHMLPVLRMFGFMYSAVVLTSLEMLQCIRVGGGLRLYSDANIECPSAVQVVPLLLTLFMLVLPCGLHRWALRRLARNGPTDVVVRALFDPYKDKYRYWNVVMLYQRGLIVALSTLIFDVFWRSLMLGVGVLFMLVIGTWLQPYRRPASNQLYTTTMLLLMLISFCAMPVHVRLSLASTNAVFSNNENNQHALQRLQIVFYLLPLLIYAGRMAVLYYCDGTLRRVAVRVCLAASYLATACGATTTRQSLSLKGVTLSVPSEGVTPVTVAVSKGFESKGFEMQSLDK